MRARNIVALIVFGLVSLASTASVPGLTSIRSTLERVSRIVANPHVEHSYLEFATQAKETALGRLESNSSGNHEHHAGRCTKENIKVRKEWGALTTEERIAYTTAVLCLQQNAAKSPPSWAAGAKTRFDDWVATHISQALTIHFTGTFFAWHRYYVWLYEEALVNECGYTGTQPYWDWAKTAVDGVESSPIFDGSETSMSGNGEEIEGQGIIYIKTPGSPGGVVVGAGSGGGCVTSGPFKNMSVNMGPGALLLPGNTTTSIPNALDYNPRCLRRSLTQEINTKWGNATSIADCLSESTIVGFQSILEAWPPSPTPGVHGAGHFTIGGDPGRDFMVSAGDPVFLLHHAMVDRVWWIWQQGDPERRTTGDNAIFGTETLLNNPPSPNVTMDTVVDLGYAGGPPLPMRDLMSTTDGPFCYVYE